ncbi:unnamed protein product [Prorocentrum cordatum]|uniref:Uncharacterized protein n=1 Tax=Prorocentrum cordatum TaxID=2364126 RepID=A0ABN9PTF1_9DINO|nr:unnamed protein product [Polarella glacialis]
MTAGTSLVWIVGFNRPPFSASMVEHAKVVLPSISQAMAGAATYKCRNLNPSYSIRFQNDSAARPFSSTPDPEAFTMTIQWPRRVFVFDAALMRPTMCGPRTSSSAACGSRILAV